MRRTILVGLLVVAAGAVGVWWWLTHREQAPRELMLYGNVDLRQVQLAFNNSGRIAAVLVQEGGAGRRPRPCRDVSSPGVATPGLGGCGAHPDNAAV
jgi:hypothetical protein